MQFSLISHSPDETTVLAAKLAPLLIRGDVLLLYGDVGVGKTDLARKIIQNRMELYDTIEDVPSPTFTLVQTYELGDMEYIHADLYRLSYTDEVFELGLERGFDHAVCFIEWPDRLGTITPENALGIDISIIDENIRAFKFSWTHHRWSDRLNALDTLDLGSND